MSQAPATKIAQPDADGDIDYGYQAERQTSNHHSTNPFGAKSYNSAYSHQLKSVVGDLEGSGASFTRPSSSFQQSRSARRSGPAYSNSSSPYPNKSSRYLSPYGQQTSMTPANGSQTYRYGPWSVYSNNRDAGESTTGCRSNQYQRSHRDSGYSTGQSSYYTPSNANYGSGQRSYNKYGSDQRSYDKYGSGNHSYDKGLNSSYFKGHHQSSYGNSSPGHGSYGASKNDMEAAHDLMAFSQSNKPSDTRRPPPSPLDLQVPAFNAHRRSQFTVTHAPYKSPYVSAAIDNEPRYPNKRADNIFQVDPRPDPYMSHERSTATALQAAIDTPQVDDESTLVDTSLVTAPTTSGPDPTAFKVSCHCGLPDDGVMVTCASAIHGPLGKMLTRCHDRCTLGYNPKDGWLCRSCVWYDYKEKKKLARLKAHVSGESLNVSSIDYSESPNASAYPHRNVLGLPYYRRGTPYFRPANTDYINAGLAENLEVRRLHSDNPEAPYTQPRHQSSDTVDGPACQDALQQSSHFDTPHHQSRTTRSETVDAPSHQQASVTSVAPSRTRRAGTWLPNEEEACIAIMKRVKTAAYVGTIDELWQEISRQLKNRGMERTAAAVKNQWNRHLRQRSGFDERSKKKPHSMVTGKLRTKPDGPAAPRNTTKKSAATGRKRKSRDDDEEEEEEDEAGYYPSLAAYVSQATPAVLAPVESRSGLDRDAKKGRFTPHE